MKSVMLHSFGQAPGVSLPRSKFPRHHGFKSTFDAGYLIPVLVDEVIPGETINCSMNAFCRLATPLKPFMDNVFLDSFFFAVPHRLIWNNWQKFNGEQTDPGDSTDYLTPQIVAPAVTGVQLNELLDYMGVPTEIPSITLNAFATRAYNLIWNEFFRDENLQDSVVVDRDDGPDTYTDYELLKRGKRFDYFTQALPWPQKGADVTLPLGTEADILRRTNATAWNVFNSNSNTSMNSQDIVTDAAGQLYGGSTTASLDPNGQLYADLSTATAASINSIREAVALQHLYERDARGGTRYTEILKSHFGVTSPDARLQRPEYLGGGSSPLNVHPVANTMSLTAAGMTTQPQGSLAAFATLAASGHSFNKSFTEHCVIIGLVSVRADLSYQQGLDRMWSRRTRWDYPWPDLAHLGEQAVLNKEIYCQGNASDDLVFGYVPRYDEWRFKRSSITGLFRSNAAASLDEWHLAQDFGALPVLNNSFISENPPIDRVIATPAEPHFLADFYFNYTCAMPLPMYAVPGLGRL